VEDALYVLAGFPELSQVLQVMLGGTQSIQSPGSGVDRSFVQRG
jgi:hypothetical protein